MVSFPFPLQLSFVLNVFLKLYLFGISSWGIFLYRYSPEVSLDLIIMILSLINLCMVRISKLYTIICRSIFRVTARVAIVHVILHQIWINVQMSLWTLDRSKLKIKNVTKKICKTLVFEFIKQEISIGVLVHK